MTCMTLARWGTPSLRDGYIQGHASGVQTQGRWRRPWRHALPALGRTAARDCAKGLAHVLGSYDPPAGLLWVDKDIAHQRVGVQTGIVLVVRPQVVGFQRAVVVLGEDLVVDDLQRLERARREAVDLQYRNPSSL